MNNNEKIMAAHQPNFLPYLGFFDKLRRSDIFLIRDEVLYVKHDFHHRNKIRINSDNNYQNPKSKYIGVPVTDPHDYIKYVSIKDNGMRKNKPWKEEILHEIQVSYQHMPHFKKYFPQLKEIISASNGNLLSLNMNLISFISQNLGINTKIILASELGLKPEHYEKSDPSEDLVKLCKAVGANVYLSGDGAREYLKLEPFQKEGIRVQFQNYKHPTYTQAFPGFVPFMSAIDALFCNGGIPQ